MTYVSLLFDPVYSDMRVQKMSCRYRKLVYPGAVVFVFFELGNTHNCSHALFELLCPNY